MAGHEPSEIVAGDRFAHDERRIASSVDWLGSGNGALGVEIATNVDGSADAWIEPIETVSNSEAGFELVEIEKVHPRREGKAYVNGLLVSARATGRPASA